MTNPEDLISAIFSLVVALVVLVAIFQVYTGGSVARISEVAGTFAVPFVLFLIVLYIVVAISQNV